MTARTAARRSAVRLVALALTAASCVGVTIAANPVAVADTAPPAGVLSTVSADPLPTVQIDGVAWDQVVVGNTVYVTGSFAFARPAGTPATTASRVARANLLAYDIRTGALITTFNHSLNAQGRSIVASPDGSRLYVAGNFTTVDGVAHNRLAAFDISQPSGPVVAAFAPNLSSTALALAATNDNVYVGGNFTTANGSSRARLAGYSKVGALLPWNPGADASVTAMTMSPDNSRVVVGGQFVTLAGASRIGIGSVLTSGVAGPWDPDFPIKDFGTSAAINSLVADGTRVYGSAFQFTTGGNFEGRFSADPTTGQLVWMNPCHGDSYDTTVIGGIVYSASHEHDCSDIGAFSQNVGSATLSNHYYLAAEPAAPSGGTIRRPIFTGGVPAQPGPRYADFSGQPSGSQLYWYPTLTVGTYTGQGQAAWSVAGNATYLSVGGEFPTANGTAQQGLVRYAIRSTAPNTNGPTNVTVPTAISQTSGTVRVAWRAASDRDNADLTYQLYRDGGTAPIYTTTVRGGIFFRPMVAYTDAGLATGSSHTYRVRVTDPLGNTVLSSSSAAATVTSAAVPSYTSTVRADGPLHFWRLNESSGSTARDWAGGADMTLAAGATFAGAAGPIAGNGTAATFSGALTSTTNPCNRPGCTPTTTISSSSVAATDGDIAPRSTYSVEAWVRTTSTVGGAVLSDSLFTPTGDSTQPNRTSPTLDRVLYLSDTGTVHFGLFSGNANTTIGSAGSYNDGQWHHLVATAGTGGAELYVDGARVASDPTLRDTAVFTGHWRLGGDSLAGWTPQPTSGYLPGTIADAAVYPGVLSAARVQAHYAAGGSVTPPTNSAPTASFTSSCTDLACSVNGSGSTDSDGTISSYAWTFGDGSTASGATPSHTYAAAGTYAVTLTVTDDDGATGSTTSTVSPTAPSVPVTAADTFSRTVASGLGTADTGGPWTVSSSARFAVNGGAGRVSLATAGASVLAYLPGSSAASTDLTLTTSIDKLPLGSVYLDITGRRTGTNQEYDGLVRIASTGAVQVNLRKYEGTGTAVNVTAPVTLPGLTYAPGTPLFVRIQATGTSPTTLRLKVWTGATEPTSWTATATDSSAALQSAGAVGLRTYLNTASTNVPIIQSIDDIVARAAGA